MFFPLYIAKRYLFAKKARNIVHYVSYASMLSVAIGTAALVIVLSVFNGFSDLVLSLYNSFDPAIKISPIEGKTSSFESAKNYLNENNILYSETLEEKVLLKYKKSEYIATLKGVDTKFKQVNELDNNIVFGSYVDEIDYANSAVVGQGVAYYLSMGVSDILNPLQVYVPNRQKSNLLKLESAFVQRSLIPVGVFSIQAEFDAQYLVSPISFVRELLDKEDQSSSLEIFCEDDQILPLQKELKSQLDSEYKIVNRFEQHQFLYKILNSEKLIVYFILCFILIIASFNIIGSLSMLMIDKKKDIIMLSNLGASKKAIRSIFFLEGFLTTQIGIFIGIALGLLVCWLQSTFGLINMGEGSFVINYYPVKVIFSDLLIVFLTVSVIGLITSWIPSNYMSKKLFS